MRGLRDRQADVLAVVQPGAADEDLVGYFRFWICDVEFGAVG
jgi:hypothetical protein